MFKLGTIEEASGALKKGKIILAAESGDGERAGYLICAAFFATPENIKFMDAHGGGPLFVAMGEELADKLKIPRPVSPDGELDAAFALSIDYADTKDGVSAKERSLTAMKCAEDGAKPEDFRRPGHLYTLVAGKGGVLEKGGAAEITVDMTRLSGLGECGIICKVIQQDGTNMKMPGLKELSEKYGIVCITIDVLKDYRKKKRQACAPGGFDQNAHKIRRF